MFTAPKCLEYPFTFTAIEVITQVYDIFFELAPGGQEYFKQSATRTFVALDDVFDGLVSYKITVVSKYMASQQVDLYIQWNKRTPGCLGYRLGMHNYYPLMFLDFISDQP